MDREGIGAISRDRVEDGIGALGPDERLGVGIVGLNESGDVGLELLDTAMDAALDLLVGEQREPALHLVEPGSAGGREMQVIARVFSEPGSDRRCLVGGVIVEHQVDVEIGWHGRFDRGQEPAEFDGVALATAGDLVGAMSRAANNEVVPWRW